MISWASACQPTYNFGWKCFLRIGCTHVCASDQAVNISYSARSCFHNNSIKKRAQIHSLILLILRIPDSCGETSSSFNCKSRSAVLYRQIRERPRQSMAEFDSIGSSLPRFGQTGHRWDVTRSAVASRPASGWYRLPLRTLTRSRSLQCEPPCPPVCYRYIFIHLSNMSQSLPYCAKMMSSPNEQLFDCAKLTKVNGNRVCFVLTFLAMKYENFYNVKIVSISLWVLSLSFLIGTSCHRLPHIRKSARCNVKQYLVVKRHVFCFFGA